MKKALKVSPKAYKKMSEEGHKHVMKNYNFEQYEKRWVDEMDSIVETFGSWETRKGYDRWHLMEVA